MIARAMATRCSCPPELSGIVLRAIGQPDDSQRRQRALTSLASGQVRQQQRLHVLGRGQYRDQVVQNAEDEADVAAAPSGESGFRQVEPSVPATITRPDVGLSILQSN